MERKKKYAGYLVGDRVVPKKNQINLGVGEIVYINGYIFVKFFLPNIGYPIKAFHPNQLFNLTKANLI